MAAVAVVVMAPHVVKQVRTTQQREYIHFYEKDQ